MLINYSVLHCQGFGILTVRVRIENIYAGTKTQAFINRFKELTRVAMDDYISDLLNDKIKNFISADNPPDVPVPKKIPKKEYSFLPEEIEALKFVKNMLTANDVSYRKTSRYAYMYISDSHYKWICRVSIKQENKLFTLHKFDNTDYKTEYFFNEADLLEQIEDSILDTYKKCKAMK